MFPSNWDDEISTGAPKIALSHTRAISKPHLCQYNYSLSCSISLGGADCMPTKLMTIQIRFLDRPGNIFGSEKTRRDNISDYVLLIRNCHPRDILRCNRLRTDSLDLIAREKRVQDSSKFCGDLIQLRYIQSRYIFFH